MISSNLIYALIMATSTCAWTLFLSPSLSCMVPSALHSTKLRGTHSKPGLKLSKELIVQISAVVESIQLHHT